MATIIWVEREHDLGVESVDLDSCTRFTLEDDLKLTDFTPIPIDDYTDEGVEVTERLIKAIGRKCIIYMKDKNKWIYYSFGPVETSILVPRDDSQPLLSRVNHDGEVEPLVDDPMRIQDVIEIEENYYFIHPLAAAHYIYSAFGAVPSELSSYEAVVKDERMYWTAYWAAIHGDELPISVKPSWDSDSRTLRLGVREWPVLTRRADNQLPVLDAFQQADWPESVRSPFASIEVLRQTCRDLNRKFSDKKIQIRFLVDNLHVRWKAVRGSE
jgi:hypothetical protein